MLVILLHHIAVLQLAASFSKRLEEAQKAAIEGGGQKRVDAQHAKGKLTARHAPTLKSRMPFDQECELRACRSYWCFPAWSKFNYAGVNLSNV